jgi:hypothetical protein
MISRSAGVSPRRYLPQSPWLLDNLDSINGPKFAQILPQVILGCLLGQISKVNVIKIGWGKPSQVPTSVALAVQQSGASRNVYLGNLPEETGGAE